LTPERSGVGLRGAPWRVAAAGVEHGGEAADKCVATHVGDLASQPLLDLDGFAAPCVMAGENLVDKAAIAGQTIEVAAAAQQQGGLDGLLEMAVRTLDTAILMGDAGVVARRFHGEMGAKRLVARGQVLGRGVVKVAKRRREAVGAMFARRTTQGEQGVLQPRGQGGKTLPAQDHMAMLEARMGHPEMIEDMVQGGAGDGNAQGGQVGEIRQAELAGWVDLAEHDIAGRPVQAAPELDAAFERAPDVGAELRLSAVQLFENGDSAQAGCCVEHRHDLALPDRLQRIRPAPTSWRLYDRRPRCRLFDPVAGGGRTTTSGRRLGRRAPLDTKLHEQSLLLNGDRATGQNLGSITETKPWTCRSRPARQPKKELILGGSP
jgi:hypothetical protein